MRYQAERYAQRKFAETFERFHQERRYVNLQVQTHAPPDKTKAATTTNRDLIFMIISFEGKTFEQSVHYNGTASFNANYDVVKCYI